MPIQTERYRAWIIGVGSLALVPAFTYDILLDLGIFVPIKGIYNAYPYGILGLLISMSVYLARHFAATNKNLQTQLLEVKRLSQKALEQERRAKALEFERKQLEQEQRAREALEAKNAELEQAYDELKRTQAELVQSEKMAGLGQIVAGVAHEINNPVNFISSP